MATDKGKNPAYVYDSSVWANHYLVMRMGMAPIRIILIHSISPISLASLLIKQFFVS